MAFNIFERWPWTSFRNLNLDWLMQAAKEAATKADEAASSVGQFDARITQNTNAIEQLGIDLETISSTARVAVNSDLEAYYRGAHITGAELLAKVRQHGDLPYVEYNNEVYMLDSISNAGDMRFSMVHTTALDDVIIRHIMIPAQSYNAAYSITNISSGGGSSGNVFAVTVTSQGGNYVSDHTYAEIYSQMQAGRIPVLLVGLGSNPTTYEVCGMGETGTRTINGQSVACIRFSDPTWMVTATNDVAFWTIDANNNVDHITALKQLAAIQNIIDIVNDGVTTNALLKTAQTLTAAQQTQVKDNIGIIDLPTVTAADNGKFLRVVSGAWAAATSDSEPVITVNDDTIQMNINPNTLYIFPNAGQLTVTPANPVAGVVNEYHFLFYSGATATTLTLPSTIRQPDGFTVEANHWYEVSILENNMLAYGWAVSA